MKLKRVIIENFRSFKDRTEIEISEDMTALVGENDVGKTSILEAIDCFFNNKIDIQDVSAYNIYDKITIGCVFSDLPEEILLRGNSKTTFESEYLLNSDNMFEVHKVWNVTSKEINLYRVYANVNAPTNNEIKSLLSKRDSDLKNILEKNNIESEQKSSLKMRQEIYKFFHKNKNVELGKCTVDFKSIIDENFTTNGRIIWNCICSRYLPIYTLFRSENVHGDKENIVRSLLEAALKSAIWRYDENLSEVSNFIIEDVKEKTKHTLDGLKKDYPDIAEVLTPEYKLPDWSKAFNLDLLRSDDEVPLSKRGSGVRRLVVQAFFQAEAEGNRNKHERGVTSVPVIYAIEEPETSLHPNLQRHAVKTLLELSKGIDQVLITTHVPALAELLPSSSIRFLERTEGVPTPCIHNGAVDHDALMKAAASLGVLPSLYPVKNAQIAVWVEGITDIWALDGFAKILKKNGSIPGDLDVKRIFYVMGGGCGQLGYEVNGKFLDMLELPQFYLIDSDKESEEDNKEYKINSTLKNRIIEWNSDQRGLPVAAAMTLKREIENYVHPDAIKRFYCIDDDKLSNISSSVWDYEKISDDSGELWKMLYEYRLSHAPEKVIWGTPVKATNAKKTICGFLLPEMTVEEIRERCVTTDKQSDGICEVEGWFHTMAKLVQEHQEI